MSVGDVAAKFGFSRATTDVVPLSLFAGALLLTLARVLWVRRRSQLDVAPVRR